MDIRKKYSSEISDIEFKLNQLEKGRYKENTGANYDGALSTNVEQLRKMFDDLIYKIENNVESKKERLSKSYKKTINKI